MTIQSDSQIAISNVSLTHYQNQRSGYIYLVVNSAMKDDGSSESGNNQKSQYIQVVLENGRRVRVLETCITVKSASFSSQEHKRAQRTDAQLTRLSTFWPMLLQEPMNSSSMLLQEGNFSLLINTLRANQIQDNELSWVRQHMTWLQINSEVEY